MTGTAFTEAKEFEEVYKLKTVAGPTEIQAGPSLGCLTKMCGF
jgi:preprotein translocase subunit SecA